MSDETKLVPDDDPSPAFLGNQRLVFNFTELEGRSIIINRNVNGSSVPHAYSDIEDFIDWIREHYAMERAREIHDDPKQSWFPGVTKLKRTGT